MKKKSNFIPVFIILLILSFIVFSFSKSGFLEGSFSITEKIFSPLRTLSFAPFGFFSKISRDSELQKLSEENKDLIKRLVEHERLKKDNLALRDQFQTISPKSTSLIPAKIVGAPSFIPGIFDPVSFIIDKGTKDGVGEGFAVIYKDNIVGKVIQASFYFSKVDLVTKRSLSLTVRDLGTSAMGVVKGEGGREMILDNVIQSDEIRQGDIIVSKGDLSLDGRGYPPDLVVGKVISLEKNPSELFKKGKVLSLLDFSSLEMVFVVRLE
ncbi:MAG: hypothetical protein A2958_02035 [Candidatus Levybacteria bacterium RIFCSPLOWO2_01_FULL_38_13]|nr:MAG: hypothetical protein A2629_02790 [Candidatus Levybacteria bacterium RIFCSPHIGHO2_01_FULL_41_15]OGH35731.1 MAG: hypothetical protein A2958_02035 [Candidatus Levybacteria bacterium RIFCSPLOWO2_01_FULL_38_13]